MQKLDSRHTTGYLKGIAITGVVVGHTLNYYLPGSVRWTEGLDNGLVAIFFVLSGYGIYHSLERRLGVEENRPRALLHYYAGRAWRVYPLFWLALLVTPFFLQAYSGWHNPGLSLGLKFLGFGGFLGAYTRPNEFTWFIYTLIPCYLAAPLLFVLLRKVGIIWYIAVNLALGAACLAASVWSLRHLAALPDQSFVYRRFILANILLFSSGMMINPLLGTLNSFLKQTATRYMAVFISTIFFVVCLIFTRIPNVLFHNSETLLGPFFDISAFCLCLAFIVAQPVLPLRETVNFLGRHSYPIYLFHLSFWGLLATWGVVTPYSISLDGPPGNLAVTLLLLPLFILICYLLDRLQHMARSRYLLLINQRNNTATESTTLDPLL